MTLAALSIRDRVLPPNARAGREAMGADGGAGVTQARINCRWWCRDPQILGIAAQQHVALRTDARSARRTTPKGPSNGPQGSGSRWRCPVWTRDKKWSSIRLATIGSPTSSPSSMFLV